MTRWVKVGKKRRSWVSLTQHRGTRNTLMPTVGFKTELTVNFVNLQ